MIDSVLHPIKSPDFSPDFLSNVKHQPRPGIPAKLFPEFIRRKECAALCGVSLDWFDRNVQRLTTEHRFPEPREPKGQRRWKWSGVIFWINTTEATDALKRARAAHRKTQEKQP